MKKNLSPLIGMVGLPPVDHPQVPLVQLAKGADDPALAIATAGSRKRPFHPCSLWIYQHTATDASSATAPRPYECQCYFSFTTFRISTSEPTQTRAK